MAHRVPLGAEDRRLLKNSGAIIGVDEVGRGSLAGPVVVCGVRFSQIPENSEIRDSKRLSPIRREQASRWIRENADDWLVLEIWPEIIDRMNILEATRLAMRTVVGQLFEPADSVVVDSVELGSDFEAVISVNKADDTYFSVAAASVVAKVHRDGLMVEMAEDYPHWGWERNKGYGTKAHRVGVAQFGRSCVHRRSFGVGPVLP